MSTNRLAAPRYTSEPSAYDDMRRLARRVAAGGNTAAEPIVNAATLEEYSAAEVLDRTNHTGPYPAMWHFRDPRAGMVVRDEVTANLVRLYPFDVDANDLKAAAELVTNLYAADRVFDSGCGPVTIGPWNGGYYRWTSYDLNVRVRKIGGLADVATGDLLFNAPVTFVNRGRNVARDIWWIAFDLYGGNGINDLARVEYYAP